MKQGDTPLRPALEVGAPCQRGAAAGCGHGRRRRTYPSNSLPNSAALPPNPDCAHPMLALRLHVVGWLEKRWPEFYDGRNGGHFTRHAKNRSHRRHGPEKEA